MSYVSVYSNKTMAMPYEGRWFVDYKRVKPISYQNLKEPHSSMHDIPHFTTSTEIRLLLTTVNTNGRLSLILTFA